MLVVQSISAHFRTHEEPIIVNNWSSFYEPQKNGDYEIERCAQSPSPILPTINITGGDECIAVPKSGGMTPEEASLEVLDDYDNSNAATKETTASASLSHVIASESPFFEGIPHSKLEKGKEPEIQEKLHGVEDLDPLEENDERDQKLKIDGLSFKEFSKSHNGSESVKKMSTRASNRSLKTMTPTKRNPERSVAAKKKTSLPIEVQEANDFPRQTAKQSRSLKEQKKTLQNDADELRKQVASLQEQLESCKDALFSLRPLAQVPDSEIVSDYESLCASISDWVGSQLRDFEERAATPVTAVSGGDRPDWEVLLKGEPRIDEYLIGSLIHDRIHQDFLGNHILYFGIPQDMAKWLQEWEESMRRVKPRKGKALQAHSDSALFQLTVIRRFRHYWLASRHLTCNRIDHFY